MRNLNLKLKITTTVKDYYKDKADLVFKHKDGSVTCLRQFYLPEYEFKTKEFDSVDSFNEYSKKEIGPMFTIGGKGLYSLEKRFEQQLLNNNPSVVGVFQMYH